MWGVLRIEGPYIDIHIIISTYELDDMCPLSFPCTRAGAPEMFGLIRVVFQKVFTQDDSVVLLVGEHRGLYVYIDPCSAPNE